MTIVLFCYLRVEILLACGIFATTGRVDCDKKVLLLDGVSSLDFGPASLRGLFYWLSRKERRWPLAAKGPVDRHQGAPVDLQKKITISPNNRAMYCKVTT